LALVKSAANRGISTFTEGSSIHQWLVMNNIRQELMRDLPSTLKQQQTCRTGIPDVLNHENGMVTFDI
jgi:hypothetical protein